MLKFFSVSILLAAVVLFPADGLRALGLGEARVDSYLGQPLDVSIRLVAPEGDSVDSLTVASASPQDYERLGIPSSALALGLDVTIDRGIDPPMIQVTSERDVSDPVVQVLVDARWASGRVLREYTLFLDPPTLPVAPPIRRVEDASSDTVGASADVPADAESTASGSDEPAMQEPAPSPPQSAAPPAIEPTRAEPAPEPVEPAATPAEPRIEPAEPEPQSIAPSPPSRTAQTVGPVVPGQTLWSIASAWRPSTGLTMNQVMLAILDENPQAFIDGNVNQLRRNAILEMPSSDDIASIGASEADRRMQAQMMAWQPMTSTEQVPVISDEALPEVIDESEAEPVAEVDDSSYRLEVVPPEGEMVEDVPAVSDAEIDEASNRLSELEDQFFAEGLDNDELYSQVEEIRDAIEARDMAGLAVANEELANLESRLRAAREERALADELAAEEEALAEAAAERSEDGAGDEVDEYFQELGDELGVGEGDETDLAAAEGDGSSIADASVDDAMDESTGVAEDELAAEVAAADDEGTDAQADSRPEAARPMTVVGSDRDGGLATWLWALIGVVVVAAVGVGLFVLNMLRKPPEEAPPEGPTIGVDELRARVEEEPANLDAHLALLNGLAKAEDEDRFSEALDAMYAEVNDDNDPRWQDALNLAVLNAPDHPLLTPREESEAGADDTIDGLDDRTREMLGILDRPEDDDDGDVESGPADTYEIESTLEMTDPSDETGNFFDEVDGEADGDSTEPQDSDPWGERDEISAEESEESEERNDAEDSAFDLAALSDPVDEDKQSNSESDSQSESVSGDAGLASDVSDSEPGDEETTTGDDLDLDFEFTSDGDLKEDDDATSLDDLDSVDGDGTGDASDDGGESPADTLDLSSESASNDTLRLDPDELAALSAEVEDKASAESEQEQDNGTVRADDTLDLVKNSDLDFEDVGDQELEAFLADGDTVVDSDDDDLIEDDDTASILDTEEPGATDVSDDGVEAEPDEDDGEPDLSDDDADVKLDLAQAYLSMDDPESARTLLEEIVSGGSRSKRTRAQELLDGI